MWLPAKVLDFLSFSKEDLIQARTERDLLRSQLIKSEIMTDWLRVRVNQLEVERSVLMEKVNGIKIPSPELLRSNQVVPPTMMQEASFEDMGDDAAKALGLPTYN